ncbi:DUF423 domain-containing protein [Stenotrophomonas sp. 24(2023)]|uniref:DUF423 domain-containing protein n=1 Tax=Stenotrophomonas sp. 24(2023) TaxID=3068324 RepID=UPI0027E09155|nr:DUF423 domain-containing protein [Stenotrophomonas sp. 24(2023)]WMJ68299.1 DUF423 domain-containing protein [Stenotrophomonas sp. 24(2023)]
MFNPERRAQKPSLLACLGALLAAAAVGLSAYASHGVTDAVAQQHLNMAALYAFAHGAVLAAMGKRAQGLLGHLGLYALLLGTLLFAGSLAGNALWQWPTRLAPAGGTTLMLGWVVLAIAALRR